MLTHSVEVFFFPSFFPLSRVCVVTHTDSFNKSTSSPKMSRPGVSDISGVRLVLTLCGGASSVSILYWSKKSGNKTSNIKIVDYRFCI